jgi:hypothetical protein
MLPLIIIVKTYKRRRTGVQGESSHRESTILEYKHNRETDNLEQ